MSTLADSLRQDLRYALRGMARSPIFTVTALLGAALGIGATTAVFRVVDRILFDVPDKDPWTFAVALPFLITISLAAAWIPSRRAARIDPIEALRHD